MELKNATSFQLETILNEENKFFNWTFKFIAGNIRTVYYFVRAC